MKNYAVIAVAASATGFAMPATAQVNAPDQSSLSTKAQSDLPGTKGGSTANPVQSPDTNTLSGKVQSDAPGTKGSGVASGAPDTSSTGSSTAAVRDETRGNVGTKN